MKLRSAPRGVQTPLRSMPLKLVTSVALLIGIGGHLKHGKTLLNDSMSYHCLTATVGTTWNNRTFHIRTF